MTGPTVRDDIPFTISTRRVTLLVGFAALLLPLVLLALPKVTPTCNFDSLSHYYYSRFGSDYFVGSLCFIGALLLFLYDIPLDKPGFKGFRWYDKWALKAAGIAAFGIAFFPTSGSGCEAFSGETLRLFAQADAGFAKAFTQDGGEVWTLKALIDTHPDLGKSRIAMAFWELTGQSWRGGALHYGSAAVMFAVLAYMSLSVFTRVQSETAREDGKVPSVEGSDGYVASFKAMTPKKKTRNVIYWTCGGLIVACILAIGYKSAFLDPAGVASWNANNMTLFYEAVGLWAFAVAWLVKGRVIGWLND